MAAKVRERSKKEWEDKTRERIRKQVACEERAFRLVEQLLEETVTEDYLLSSCQLLQPHHYADIVEERAIDKRCGYPICPNPLGCIPKQKYQISTKHNRIYDITERKNFCSDQCLAASRFLAKQISTSPVWIRDQEPPSPISLLSRQHTKGEKGDEVIGLRTLSEDPYLQSRTPKNEKEEEDGRRRLAQGRSSSTRQGRSPPPRQASSSENPPEKGDLHSADSPFSSESSSSRSAQAMATLVSASSAEVEVCARLSAVSIQGGDGASHQCQLTERMGQMTLEQAAPSPDQIQPQPSVCLDGKEGMPEKDSVTAAAGGDSASIKVPLSSHGGRESKEQLELGPGRPESKTHGEDRSQRPGESKTDYLMRLLDKRKHLLSKMVDIQVIPFQGGTSSSPSLSADKKDGEDRTTVNRDEKRDSMRDMREDSVHSSSQIQPNSNTSKPDISLPDSSVSAHKSVPVSAHKSVPASAHKSVPASAHKSVPVSAHKSVPVSAHKSVPASAHKSVPVSAHKSVPVSAHKSVPASAHKSVPASAHKSVPASSPSLTPTTSQAAASMPGSQVSMQTADQDTAGNKGGRTSRKPGSQAGKTLPQAGTTLPQSPQASPLTPSPLEVVARQVQAWVTPETIAFIRKAEVQGTETGRTRQELEAACLRLEAEAAIRERELERLEELEGQGGQEKVVKPHGSIPAYEILAKQTQEFSIKVQQFYSGGRITAKGVEDADKEKPDEKVYLPPVDFHDQLQIRRRIVLERLDKVLPEVLSFLALSIQDISAPLRELVHSLSLASDNICFRPSQWLLVALILLQMLSQREEKIQDGFARASCVRFISTLLGGVGLGLVDLESTTKSLLQPSALDSQDPALKTALLQPLDSQP